MAEYTRVEVESSDNSPMSAFQVYRNIGGPFEITHVRIYEGEPEGKLCRITGWSSESDGTPSPAYAVQIEDSSEGVAYLIYGGDLGIRLAPADSDAAWSIDDSDQWGETHLVMADLEDITPA